MKATKELPEGYRVLTEIDLSKNKRAALLINLSSIPLVVLFGLLFLSLAGAIRSQERLRRSEYFVT